ncbi:DUF6503 family protein [Gillisia sp. JM1]|uniref:DUF6503 family protein n=1 Tax=Gillisia sp. JM1 TaxID=1283286 RepID=UPI000413F20F|nr:DUF6503 family protein [Gillisia sp. JM1]
MKQLALFSLLCLLISCQETSKKQEFKEEKSTTSSNQEMTDNRYPEDFAKVLEAHGGIEQWNNGKTLKFTIGDGSESQQHIVDLKNRMDKTVTTDYEIGYDGNNAWVLNKNGNYKGNAIFMHNLMFYFYAMPFVLADQDANYSKAEDKEINGNNYHGLKITFDSGVGASSSDEYYLYYNPETYKMAWLSYKATFGSDKKPEWPNYISYDKWSEVDGIFLPTSIAWYNVDKGEVKEEKNRVDFNTISVSNEAQPENFYSVPANATVVESKQ